VKILLVEDDKFLTELLTRMLTEQTYLVETAADGEVGWELVEAFQYDLILLDLMLPKLDGVQFCKKLRDRKNLTPVILLTSQDSATHKVSGLDAGADDYLVKPFDAEELLARIRALLRRENSNRSSILTWQNLQLNLSSCIVTYNDQLLSLTSKEYKLLELFLRNQQRIFSQSALISQLWSLEEAPTENGVRAHIKALRRKLKQAGCEDLIETVYGLGYRLKANLAHQAEQPKTEQTITTPSAVRNSNKLVDLAETGRSIPLELAEAWQRHHGEYLERVTIIRKALADLASNSLSDTLRQDAYREAHTLAGSLGSFELHHLSQICCRFQALFTEPLTTKELSTSEVAALFTQLTIIENALSTDLKPALALQPTGTQLNRLLVISQDAALIEQLYDSEITQAWQITVLDAIEAIAAITQLPPDAVLLDLSFADTIVSGFEFLAARVTSQASVPVIVLTRDDDFEQRVKITRLGGGPILQKPITPQQIISAVTQTRQYAVTPDGKLLVVDDDPIILDRLTVILQPWGFQVEALNHPRAFWQVLEQTNPDLLILDMMMPEFSGLDLCQVVRNDPRWETLPVLFLSINLDVDLIYQIFQAGADDYVRKPIIEPELVARVINQLKRDRSKRKE